MPKIGLGISLKVNLLMGWLPVAAQWAQWVYHSLAEIHLPRIAIQLQSRVYHRLVRLVVQINQERISPAERTPISSVKGHSYFRADKVGIGFLPLITIHSAIAKNTCWARYLVVEFLCFVFIALQGDPAEVPSYISQFSNYVGEVITGGICYRFFQFLQGLVNDQG